MNKNGHGFCGVVLSGGAIYISYKLGLKPIDIFSLAAGIMIGSFLPDIDANHSTIRGKSKGLSNVYTGIQSLAKRNKVTHDVFKHRGALFHSVWTVLILTGPIPLHKLSASSRGNYRRSRASYFRHGYKARFRLVMSFETKEEIT